MSRIIKTIAQSDLSEEFVNKLRCERTAALICRLCATLRKTDCFVSIRDPNLNLCVKLARCCQFRFPENDRLPENVCVDCVHVLNECWTFAEKVRVAQESLNALYAVNEESEEEQEAEQTNKEIANTSSANPITNRSVECFENPSKIKQEIFAQIPIEELDTNFEIDENELDAEDDEDSADEEDSSPEIDPNYLPTEETDMLESLDDDMTELMDGVPDSKIEIIDTWKEYPWTCTICTGVFTSVIELRNHVTLNHNKTDAGYVCADCSKVYTKYYLFLNHVRTHRSQLKMYCDICSEFLDVPKAVSSHRDKHQCGDLVSLCTSCCKAFKNSSAMLTHLRSHSVQKKFQCELCDKSFGSKPNLRAHQKIHMGLKEFVCDQCGKGFVQKANLDEHLITHVDATPYECNECGRMFKTPGRLSKHKNIHTDIRPHKCKECGREFREKDTLRVHLRIHTGVMPYECEFCGKRFRFRSILTTHRHQHTGVRPYSCLECNHHFTNWPNYNKHMIRRHGINTSGSTRRPQSKPAPGLVVPIISSGLDSASDLATTTTTTEIEKFEAN